MRRRAALGSFQHPQENPEGTWRALCNWGVALWEQEQPPHCKDVIQPSSPNPDKASQRLTLPSPSSHVTKTCKPTQFKVWILCGFPDGSAENNLPANPDLIPGLESSPGGGNGNALQYPCLGNSMDRGAWLAIVHGVATSQTRLSDWTTGN